MVLDKYIWKGTLTIKSDIQLMLQCSNCGATTVANEESYSAPALECDDCGFSGCNEDFHFFMGRWIQTKKKLTPFGQFLELVGFNVEHPQDRVLPEFLYQANSGDTK